MSFKFDDDGVVKPFHGNTIICHIPQQTEFFETLLNFHRFHKRLSFHNKITLVPSSSYHVTIMNACHEHDKTEGHWPTELSSDATISECHAHLSLVLQGPALSELCQRQGHTNYKLRIVPPVEQNRTSAKPRSINVVMVPANEQESERISELRHTISNASGLVDPSHDSNVFHITLAYINEPLNDGEVEELYKSLDELHELINKISPNIILNAPEFVTFTDMFYFRTLFTIR